MKVYRIQAVVLRHIYETRRNFDRLTDMVYWPVLDIIMWGFFSLYLTRSHNLQPNAVSFLFGAIILWNLFRNFQRDMAVGFLAELWSRNLINLFSTPLTVSEYIAGLIVVNLLKAMVGLIVASLVAWFCYSYNFFPILPLLIPFMLGLILFALAVGVMITGLIFRYSTSIQGISWSFVGILMPISCVFYPFSLLPAFLRPIAWALPTTHAFEGMREALADQGFSLLHFYWCMALNIGYLLLSVIFFKIIFESARARGLLVKFD
jgi:ABC-2 type transport system permease protein